MFEHVGKTDFKPSGSHSLIDTLPGVRNYYRRLGYTLCRLDTGEYESKEFGKGPPENWQVRDS